MAMAAKLIMRWNVRHELESEYFEFLVHELIPSMNKLGISDIQVWYTAYGTCEQKMAEGGYGLYRRHAARHAYR
jgi:hypothetical protein